MVGVSVAFGQIGNSVGSGLFVGGVSTSAPVVPIALVANKAAQQIGSATATTAAMNTTGATLGVTNVSCYDAAPHTPTDSKSNTWTGLTVASAGGGSCQSQIFYAKNATVGSGHTVSVSGTDFCSIATAWFSNVTTSSPFDVQATTQDITGSSTSMGGGSLTPSASNSLVVGGGCFLVNLNTVTAVDSGFTITDSIQNTNGNGVGTVLAYIVETSIVAKNPLFTLTFGTKWAAGNAVFK